MHQNVFTHISARVAPVAANVGLTSGEVAWTLSTKSLSSRESLTLLTLLTPERDWWRYGPLSGFVIQPLTEIPGAPTALHQKVTEVTMVTQNGLSDNPEHQSLSESERSCAPY